MSTDADAIANAFLAITPVVRLPRTEEALRGLLTAASLGHIYNQNFKAVKDTLDRSVEGAWELAVHTPFVYAGKWQTLPTDIQAFDRSISSHHYVRDHLSIEKKLAKTTLQHPMIEAMRRINAAAAPIAHIMEELKTKIVKGRKPNPEAQARREAKLATAMKRGHCGCCMREQAVLPNGRIHDHGYEIPYIQEKTASCAGRRFKPLEVSDEGLRYMIGQYTIGVKMATAKLEMAPRAVRIVETNWQGKKVEHTPSDPDWARQLQMYVREHERTLSHMQRSLAEYQQHLANWRPAA